MKQVIVIIIINDDDDHNHNDDKERDDNSVDDDDNANIETENVSSSDTTNMTAHDDENGQIANKKVRPGREQGAVQNCRRAQPVPSTWVFFTDMRLN